MLSLLAKPTRGASVTWHPLDSRWYNEIGSNRADSGITIVPESALSVAVLYRAINVLAHSVASIPLIVQRQTDNDGKERAREHPAYHLLHDRPNTFQTSFRWRHQLMVNAVLHGNHYSEILPGPGAIGQLVPLSPDTTRVVDQLSDGRLLYVTREQTAKGFGPERRLLQDDVFHARGFSVDGKSGIPLTRLAKNAIGLALTAERHGSMFLRRGSRFSGLLSSDAAMTVEQRKENEAAWQRAWSGPDGSGGTPMLSGGLKFTPTSANNRDSQWLEARTFQVEELLRFLGVPGVLCGYADKTATYASAEQFFLSFVTHVVRPWTENIAQELNASVITEAPQYFSEFVLEGLLKGDIKTRYSAHQLAIQSGWKTRNEVRVEESYNRGPGELDTFLEPLNMVQAGASRDDDPRLGPEEGAHEEARRAQLTTITRRSVERLVRKEITAIAGSNGRLGAAARFAGNPSGWREWLAQFYGDHATNVATDLGVTPDVAGQYCTAQQARFASLTAANDSAETDSIAALLRLTPAWKN